jgi:predicted TIM-barrel fold metal-dependent hydrolase
MSGLAMLAAKSASLTAKAAQPSVPVNFAVPPGACDTHVHVFDGARFPFVATRVYTPEPASLAELQALHRALHVERVVVVHPSVYGTDNSCSLDAIRQLGSRARGVALIDDKTTDAQLVEMHQAGMRGVRVNLETGGTTDPVEGKRRFDFAARRAQAHDYHVQIYTRPSVILGMRSTLEASPVPLVFDHFGGAEGSAGLNQPGFDVLLNLVRSGKAYIKISGAYRGSSAAPAYADMAPFAKAFIAANPQRVLWGTDWPHPDTTANGRKPTDIFALLPIEDGTLMNQLAVWAPDAATRKLILVDNPARLYGF